MDNRISNQWVLIYFEDTLYIIDEFYADSQGVDVGTSYKVKTFDTEAEKNQYILDNKLKHYENNDCEKLNEYS